MALCYGCMAQPRHLREPPISEAVIDIRVRLDAPAESIDFSRLGQRIHQDFPKREQRHGVHFVIDAAARTTTATPRPGGFLYRSADGTEVVQSKPEGFAFSRLKPYQDWDRFSAEAVRMWNQYKEEFGPQRVIRVATRFINRLTLPPFLDFDDYLTIAPRLPQKIPQQLSAFSTAVTVPEIAEGCLALIRTKFDSPAPAADSTIVLLDIDVLHECDMDPDDGEALRAALDHLRQLKNRIFFGSLTERAVEIFA